VVLDAVSALGEDDVELVAMRVEGDEDGGARRPVGVEGLRLVSGEAEAYFV
jgi:hypothetical protein